MKADGSAAAYWHRMSGAEDPQLHTHVVVVNVTGGADGRWTALKKNAREALARPGARLRTRGHAR
jgi:conjugative relaxase-like TrwC/TraI family protein